MFRILAGFLICASSLVACGGDPDSLDDFLPEIPKPTGEAQQVWAGEISVGFEAELIDGPARSGMVGDFFMRNSKARFVIQAPTRVIGVIPQGGNLVDAVPLDGSGSDAAQDHFGELSMIYLVGRTCDHQTVEVVQDGSKGGAAAIIARGVTAANDFISIRGLGLIPVSLDLDPDVPDSVECATTYILEPDADSLGVQWTLYNPGERGIKGPFAVLSDVGGVVEVFAPTVGFERLGIEALTDGADPKPLEYAVHQGPGVAYGMLPRGQEPGTGNSSFLIQGVSLLLFGADELLDITNPDAFYLDLPGRSGITHGIDVSVGFDAADAEQAYRVGRGEETVEIAGTVQWSSGGAPPNARIGVFRDIDGNGDVGPDDVVISYIDAATDGTFSGWVASGDYVIRADVPDLGRSPSLAVSGGGTGLSLSVPAPVVFDYAVSDEESGNPIPAKLTVIGRHPAMPDLRLHPTDDRVSGIVCMIHAVTGTSVDVGDGADKQLQLPAGGNYRVFATRGTEWSADSVQISPTAGDPPGNLTLSLRRVIDTAGYVASEYHVHSLGSPDSPITNSLRVKTAVVDGVELFASTDHDYVSDLQSVIESMGLSSLVRSINGLEVTPFSYGHFNAWPVAPLDIDPSFGAIDWGRNAEGFSMIPGEIFDALRNRGAEIVQVNHPRAIPGSLVDFMQYFDRNGLVFDYDAKSITGDINVQPVPNDWMRLPPGVSLWDDSFNALEVWNGFDAEDSNGDGVREVRRLDVVMRDWFNFLSFGMQVTPIGSSDTHKSVKDPMGLPRTFVRVSDDSSGALSSGAIVAETLDTLLGRNNTPVDIVVTNGPHISVTEGTGTQSVIGATLDGSGGITLNIDVVAPGWSQIDTIEIFANSTPDTDTVKTVLQPLACYTSRGALDPADPCALSPLGGAQTLNINVVAIPSSSFNRYETSLSVPLTMADIVNRAGAVGGDAWLVVRVRGTRAIYPIYLQEDTVTDANVDTLVSGSQAEIDAALQTVGVPATAFTAPIYVDFDGGGYRAPFSPQ